MSMPEEDPPAGVPEWVLTYGDMMSLLLCFFILLAAFSEIKAEKKNAVIKSILRQFGDHQKLAMFNASQNLNRSVYEQGATVEPVPLEEPTNRKRAESGGRGQPGRNMRVRTVRDGKRLTIGGPLLFEPGEAVLTPDAKKEIKRICDTLRGKRHLLEVKGYSPPTGLPPGSRFADPLDLAYARTRAIVNYMVNEGQIRRSLIRMSLAAPAEVTSLKTLGNGESMLERVDITTMESGSSDYGRGGAPVNQP